MKDIITPEEFLLSMKKLGIGEACPKIAVAVSGGGDSLALALLLQEWVAARGGEMLALTVDHGLRPDSAAEARQVKKLLQGFGIRHEILLWQGDKPATHVQEMARAARYDLLLKYCRAQGFPVLATAHNLEDQIETFWMRLAHGSGLDGLAAMAAARQAEGISLIRPVLPFPRGRLRATCVQRGCVWVEDPSNRNEKFLRVRLRQFEELLAAEGMTPARLGQTLQKLEEAREALQAVAEKAVAECVKLYPEGYAKLKNSAWREYPRDLQRRILQRVLAMVVPSAYPPGFEALEQTRRDLLDPAFTGKTLAGCEIFSGAPGEFLLVREADGVEGRTPAAEGKIWDARFVVSGFPAESLEIGVLGDAGLAELRKNTGAALQKLEALPFKARRVLPALWRGESLLAVPHVGYYAPASPAALKTGRFSLVKIV
jgi:tRNA(Ile)-lysidine synthase